MTELNLLYSELEDDLRASVRDVLTDRCDPRDVIPVYDGDRSLAVPLWSSLSQEMGLGGLLVPEDRGGAGASAREAAVVLEELGRAAAPVPFLTSGVIATAALLQGDGPAADDLLASLAAGASTAALLVPFSTAPGIATTIGRVDPDGGVGIDVTSVAGAIEADVLLVPVALADGVALYAVPAHEASVEAVTSLDMTRPLADVRVVGARGRPVVSPGAGETAIRRALLTGAALLASEQLGVAQWSLATTIEHLKARRQFGRVLGGYQALKHRLADLYVSIESAAAAARYAAAAFADDDPDREVAAAVAQAWCSDVAVQAAEEAIQLLGGIGMTWEHPAHLFLKRAKADQIALGTPGFHRSALADLVDLR
ncbi:acyl-CoA/acyl-ACP dehydrogenase [Microbacterium betulae]|uniref:Acyl-CoA/acyl-ACP dehydrogenase n=1 Tax=Microbacterium betulae TaxID=2981139 RepID=A0AA97I4Q5_9MICO|nr:acyl-CoA dehydrogenase family protein [Microbacterium sp. AB]WOF22846.1 acyl-CoA/acyl-ACP dehydrogenase [Microbacterium sp. AB]